MPDAEAINGRGLPIVDELAKETYVVSLDDPATSGKVIYATLPYP
ncbi:hypothetical protein HNP84_002163 [Thermocatellispora tengchongensis]|uniref:Uncharacterized protein n=1 Tax=Thermocatellispora tengchongensis TaxID=1073253 RepID=A0A840P5F5_9ACTN|nr:hypothetical protein [Thermocatellispora tengchongensis]